MPALSITSVDGGLWGGAWRRDEFFDMHSISRRVELLLRQKRGRISMLDRLFGRNRGQGLVEYALIIALVAVVVIGTLILLGPQINSIFGNIHNNL
jgi:pilus assembly protein Flp/PilA